MKILRPLLLLLALATLPACRPADAAVVGGSSPASNASRFQHLAVFESPLIDFTATGTTTFSTTGAIAGYYPAVIRYVTVLTAQTGALSTSPTVQAGNDVSMVDLIPSNTASLTASIGHSPCIFAGNSGNGFGGVALRDSTFPFVFDITAGATGTGGFTAVGKMQIVAALIPLTN